MGPFASAWATPLAAGGVASLVSIPMSVTWGAAARGWLGLPAGFALAEPAFLVVASVAVAALVAVPFALAFRYAREPVALGSVGAGALLAMALPAWLVAPLLLYPGVAGGPAFGLGAHLLAGATSFAIVLGAASRADAPAVIAEGLVGADPK